MKPIFYLIILFSLLITSCGTLDVINLSGSVKYKDNNYSYEVKDTVKEKNVKASIEVKNKRYTCEFNYTVDAPSELGFSFDFSHEELTGEIGFTYKKVTTMCSVENKVILTEEEKKTEEIPVSE
jgi:hypothetical protein